MTGRKSSMMEKAIKLIKLGKTATEAANKTGIRRESIYRDAEYKAYRAEKNAPKSV
jgi:hypothetical protein